MAVIQFLVPLPLSVVVVVDMVRPVELAVPVVEPLDTVVILV
jgi:hypothetical protein